MLGLFMGAAVLGIVIGVMEEGEFPGWYPMLICVLSAVIPAAIVLSRLPPHLFLVGLLAGAVCAGFVISAMCGMSVKRASTAAGIYLAVAVVIELAFGAMMST